MTGPDEPIALSAPLARSLAPRLCRKDPASGEDCSWYHGLWQDLRIVGLAAPPIHQKEFFLSAFGKLAKRRRSLRVLISGAADYSILAHVLWGCEENRIAVDVVVIDVCDTPLFLNQWYADRAGRKITTVRGDIFEFQSGAPFDVICSHSFLIWFPAQRRAELLGKWLQLLAPEGAAVAVNRVYPPGTPPMVAFSPEEARVFYSGVGRRLQETQVFTEADRVSILERVQIYLQRRRYHVIGAEDLAALFQQTGYRLELASTIASSDPRSFGIDGKAIPRVALHSCIVATKAP
jgi:hypothetical protein